MIRYLIRRLPSALITLAIASILVFLLLRLAPGSPAESVAGPDASREAIAAIEQRLGLDEPWPVQYFKWAGGLVSGKLGKSLVTDQPITSLILSRAESTISLALAATFLMSALGLALGVLGGTARSRHTRTALDGTYSVLLSLPTYVTSVLLLALFGVAWPVIPVSGEALWSDGAGQEALFLVLPAVALAIPHSAVIGRLLQTNMQEALNEDYVRFAIAKGLSRRRVVWVHVLKNSIGTAVVIIGIRFGSLLGGALVIEALFARNGLGQLMVSSVLMRDYLVVQDLILFAVLTAVSVQVLSEIALAAVDPRIRLT